MCLNLPRSSHLFIAFRDFFYKFRADFFPCTSVAAAAGRPHRAAPEAPWQAPGPRGAQAQA